MKPTSSMLILTLSLLIGTTAHATPLSDASVLRKLSLSLKGLPPTPQEYADLNLQTTKAAKQAYLDKQTHLYLSSAEHRNRLIFQLSERFAVMPPGITPEYAAANPMVKQDYMTLGLIKIDAMTNLFGRLTTENLSWDQLLNAKSYTLFGPVSDNLFSSSGVSDFGFMAYFDKQIPADRSPVFNEDIGNRPAATAGSTYSLSLADDDARAAGIVTTARFSARYNTTGINKNRRRAAAIFRTFLCDPMIPAISTDGDRTHDFNNVAFADKYEVTSEAQILEAVTVDPNARHGSDAQCASCHYKLDPLGRTFQSMGLSLAPEPSSGALVFKSSSTGQLVNIPLRGLGDLGPALTKQQDYVNCQVGWFWDQYIGKDIQLSPTRRTEIVNAFENVGRRTNDFTAYLVSQPEFREKPKQVEYITFDKVQPIFKRCDACHNMNPDMPSFAKLPFSMKADGSDHATWVSDINDRITRPVGARGRMPKDPENWNPADVELIKNWILQGARDENGQPTVGGGK